MDNARINLSKESKKLLKNSNFIYCLMFLEILFAN